MDSNNHEKSNKDIRLGVRPLCGCCAGGERRKGKKYCRVKSNFLSRKANRSKPKNKVYNRDSIRKN